MTFLLLFVVCLLIDDDVDDVDDIGGEAADN